MKHKYSIYLKKKKLKNSSSLIWSAKPRGNHSNLKKLYGPNSLGNRKRTSLIGIEGLYRENWETPLRGLDFTLEVSIEASESWLPATSQGILVWGGGIRGEVQVKQVGSWYRSSGWNKSLNSRWIRFRTSGRKWACQANGKRGGAFWSEGQRLKGTWSDEEDDVTSE